MDQIEEFFREKHGAEKKRLYRITKSMDDAEDILQEAYLRAIKYYLTYDPKKGAFTTWIGQIIRGCVRDYKKLKHGLGYQTDIEDLETYSSLSTSFEVNPIAVNTVVADIIEREKDPQKKEVLHFFFLYNLKPREIYEVTAGIGMKDIYNILAVFKKEVKDGVNSTFRH